MNLILNKLISSPTLRKTESYTTSYSFGHDHCALESYHVIYLHVDKQYVLCIHVWSQQKALGFINLYLEHQVIISERQKPLHKHLLDAC